MAMKILDAMNVVDRQLASMKMTMLDAMKVDDGQFYPHSLQLAFRTAMAMTISDAMNVDDRQLVPSSFQLSYRTKMAMTISNAMNVELGNRFRFHFINHNRLQFSQRRTFAIDVDGKFISIISSDDDIWGGRYMFCSLQLDGAWMHGQQLLVLEIASFTRIIGPRATGFVDNGRVFIVGHFQFEPVYVVYSGSQTIFRRFQSQVCRYLCF